MGLDQPTQPQPQCVLAHVDCAHRYQGGANQLPTSESSDAQRATRATLPATQAGTRSTTASTLTASAAATWPAAAWRATTATYPTAISSTQPGASSGSTQVTTERAGHQRGAVSPYLCTCLGLEHTPRETELTSTPFRLQVSWSNDDLLGTSDANQNMPCGTFYANLCAYDSDTLLQLVDLPPGAPPPPMAPDSDLASLVPTRVMAKGGLIGLVDASAQSLSHCTDNAQTQCVATSYEQPVRYARTRPFLHTHTCARTHCCMSCHVRSG